jgi:hypothetical protein
METIGVEALLLEAALARYMEACGTPWPPSLADVAPLPCMGPEPHPGHRHWHQGRRTLDQLLEWS